MDAAATLFAKYDYAEVNMRMIARNAGVTSPAIYNHYDSKDDLFSKTVLRMMAVSIALLSEILVRDGTWKERLGQMLAALGEGHKSSAASHILSSTTQIKIAREPEKFRAILEARNDISGIFQSLIRDAIIEGDMPKETDVYITGDLLMAFSFNAIGTVTIHWDPKKYMSQILEAFELLTNPDSMSREK